MQAINATTMPKVVICHTPVIHNHYLECNVLKLASLNCDPSTCTVKKSKAQASISQDEAVCLVICVVLLFFCFLFFLSSSVVAFV